MNASVWITRARPGAESTARRVTTRAAPLRRAAAGGHQPVRPRGLEGVAALAFTSANAVRAFAEPAARALPVFAVGDATARGPGRPVSNRARSFRRSWRPSPKLSTSACLAGVVLHPRAAEPAHDLVAILAQEGVPARDVVVYRTDTPGLDQADLHVAGACDFVLLQSAKAARALRHLGLERPRPVCQSAAIAEALGDPRARIATAPNEDALIAALLAATR